MRGIQAVIELEEEGDCGKLGNWKCFTMTQQWFSMLGYTNIYYLDIIIQIFMVIA